MMVRQHALMESIRQRSSILGAGNALSPGLAKRKKTAGVNLTGAPGGARKENRRPPKLYLNPLCPKTQGGAEMEETSPPP
jgi:hypothetical protein